MHIYQEDMLAADLFYLADYVRESWKRKAEAVAEGSTYIGGV